METSADIQPLVPADLRTWLPDLEWSLELLHALDLPVRSSRVAERASPAEAERSRPARVAAHEVAPEALARIAIDSVNRRDEPPAGGGVK